MSIYRRVILLQILLVAVTSVGFFAISGAESGQAALIGGIAAWLPNVFFVGRITLRPAVNPDQMLKRFYSAELMKLVLTGFILFLIMQRPEVRFLPLLTGYAVALSAFWWALLARDNN